MTGNSPPVIVCAADNGYAMPLAVMLRSMAEQLRRYPQVAVWVIDGGISAKNKKKVLASLPPDKLVVTWVKPNLNDLKGMPVFGHVSLASYYRLLLGNLLPSKLTKVIYLDVDLLVLGDIGELWDTDLSQKTIAAVAQDRLTAGEMLDESIVRHYHMASDRPYFNAGVLVIDLPRWRDIRIHEKALEFVRDYAPLIRFWDQDILNCILRDEWTSFDEKWNRKLHHLLPLSHVEMDAYQSAGGIIHFATAIKPWSWDWGQDRAVPVYYFQWLDRTQWKGWRPKKTWINHRTIRLTIGNKYWYGMLVRKVPVVGRIWAKCRKPAPDPL